MDEIIKKLKFTKCHELNYCEKEGVMYQRDMTNLIPYDKDYYMNYISYEKSPIAEELNNFRVKCALEFSCNSILDIGIGSGCFIKEIERRKHSVFGYDINEYGIDFLKNNGIFLNPYTDLNENIDCITFFDSLEHIVNPFEILQKVYSGSYVIISIPIFQNLLEVKKSKHYKPNEHIYYFSEKGLINYMNLCNYIHIKSLDNESKLGRESIYTFVFLKK